MKALLVLLTVFISSGVFTQVILTGKVIQKDNGELVPYASVGLLKQNRGSNADKEGVFSFTIQQHSAPDSFIISSVGFETKKIFVPLTNQHLVIELEKKFAKLAEVVVKDKWEKLTLGESRGCGEAGLVSSGYQTQLAQVFTAPVEHAMLTSVRICFSSFFFMPERYRFRIRVYDADERGTPSDDLCNEVIEIRSGSRQELVDLSKYNIRIPKNKFFIALQWIYIPENERGPSGSQDFSYVYGPPIGVFKDPKPGDQAWMQLHNGRWTPMIRSRAAMEATIKY